MKVDLITDADALSALQPQWNALWRRSRSATAFQSPSWLLPWWAQFGTNCLRVVAIYARDQLVGLLPLYILEENGVRKLLPLGISLSDYIDALVDPDYPNASAEMLRSISEIAGWDQCHLPCLRPGAALREVCCPAPLRDTTSEDEPCSVLILPRESTSSLGVLPRITRRKINQARNRAERRGSVEILTGSTSNLDALMDALFRLHAQKWRSDGLPEIVVSGPAAAFHRAAARQFAEQGMLRLTALAIGGEVVAVLYGFLAKGESYAYLIGRNPEFQRESVGTLLLGEAMRAAVKEGAREYHFLRGREAFKRYWGMTERPNLARTIVRA
jgi:CelD/BcsL family acetyltransferase involved in cellulose biosynthesis